MRNHLNTQRFDECGRTIPDTLGEPSEGHNMTPQHRSVNRNVGMSDSSGTWFQQEIVMRDFLREGRGFIRHEVFLAYPNLQTGRPNELKWRTQYNSHDNTLISNITGAMPNTGPFQ